jgi:hypothetical protein
MRRLAPLCALTALVAPWAHAAAPIGYAQATGYYKKDSRPTLYQPLNLLDNREGTAWCSTTSDPLNDQLMFGFKGTARIDEVRVYTGNGFDANTFKEFSRAKKLSIKSPTGAQTMTVADQRGLQAVALNPPMAGAQFVIEVLDIYPADDPESPTCITDIVFYSEGKPLNGAWLTQKLKFDKSRASLLGTWFSGPDGAPDRFLSFFFDGTFRVVHDPYDPQVKDRVLSGGYDASPTRISLALPGKGKVSARIRRDKKTQDPSGAVTQLLVLDGGELPEDLKQSFRSQL